MRSQMPLARRRSLLLLLPQVKQFLLTKVGVEKKAVAGVAAPVAAATATDAGLSATQTGSAPD